MFGCLLRSAGSALFWPSTSDISADPVAFNARRTAVDTLLIVLPGMVTGAVGSIHRTTIVAERRSSMRTLRRTCVSRSDPSGIEVWLEYDQVTALGVTEVTVVIGS